MRAAILALLLAAPAAAEPNNDLHVALTAIGAGASYGTSALITQDRGARFIFALAVPMAAGFGREYTQARIAGAWGTEHSADMGRNILGALFGALFSLAVDQAIERAGACKYIDGWRVCFGVPSDD